MEITKGKWKIRNSIPQSSSQGDITVHTDQIIAVGINADLDLDFQAVSFCGKRGNKQAESNAILIADAGNTYEQTNKLPSELAEANKELLDTLKDVKYGLEVADLEQTKIYLSIINAIKKHSKNA